LEKIEAAIVKFGQRHALMFLGRTAEAKTVYLAHRGEKMGQHDWNYYIAMRYVRDFSRISPSCAVEATSRPSREKMLPRQNPRPACALGLSCA